MYGLSSDMNNCLMKSTHVFLLVYIDVFSGNVFLLAYIDVFSGNVFLLVYIDVFSGNVFLLVYIDVFSGNLKVEWSRIQRVNLKTTKTNTSFT
ncbi:hypothetical protein Smp_178960 [Schistosoma mansoni]|uniref:hypothetical protein n=1 Tax=Schistosoma mansoni TaxID=6183 RepID=UPI00022DC096|nr:hypothetical protein Smp_178960 [Schistosoma mansoni]|eukprot:XP_018648919.1 hypothetical protein Smp_178960 [Schistosoma mansoni]